MYRQEILSIIITRGGEFTLSQYNQDFTANTQNNIITAMKKLNQALNAFGRSLSGINSSMKNFHHLAKDCQKYKL